MRRTKIVCTLGPATSSEERIEALIRAGMDVARLNFSHGTLQEHTQLYHRLRAVTKRLRTPVAVMQDLQGPKIRTGALSGGRPITLKTGDRVHITTQEVEGTPELISTTYENLPADVRPGDRVLLDDGLIELRVLAIENGEVRCQVVHGGALGEHKGINLPGVVVAAPALTEKDRADLELGLRLGVDYVALSFVREPGDVLQAKELIRQHGADTPVIAKLEKPEALDKLDAILEVADGVIVARGDLGVELAPEKVPVWQKRIIQAANHHRIPVITATQMLESMITHPSPTRAETSDVANAIFDGTDAVMLSAETATGAYPLEAVQVMGRIAQEAEAFTFDRLPPEPETATTDSSRAIGRAACQIAQDDPNVTAIVAFTISGYTARLISKERPRVPVLALTPHDAVYRRLALLWGISPFLCDYVEDVEGMIAQVERTAGKAGIIAPGNDVVLVGSLPVPARGPTNFLKVHRIGG